MMSRFKKFTNKVGEKISNSKIIKNPVFLVIGLIAIILVIALIYFIFLKYSPIMNFKYEGYAISGKDITENLLGSSESSDGSASTNKNLELVKIEEQGTIFKKLNDYFVGSKKKTEINLNYPIYINNNSAIYNLAENSTLISEDFEEIAGYPNLSISEGKVYDGNNLERTDGKEYIFVKTADEIYINLSEIKINTIANEYTIPVNSIIAFNENEIRYYTVNNNVLVFNEINDVDSNSSVQMVENNYTYEELLTRLRVLRDETNNNSNNEIQPNIIQEDSTNIKSEENKQNEVVQDKIEETEQEEPQNGYIKPEVTVEDFTPEVYTAKSTLTIKDPAGRIVESPTFEIYKDNKLYLRRTYKNSGNITVTGLVPETEYKIVGKYVYLNENGQKVENTFYEGIFTTKGYEELGSIDIQKENGEIFSNKIQLTKVKITSDLNAEAIKGISQVELETGEIRTVLKNSQVNELLQGKEIEIESSEGLKSDSKINYVIKFYDKNGIELKVTNNEGETRTSKQAPTAKVSIKEQDIVSVTLKLSLTNKDNVKLENYKYVVTRPNGETVKEEKLAENEKEILLNDLDQNQYYKIGIYADYDLNDNKGKQENVEIGNLVFATQPISTLGSLELTVENKELTSTTSTISYKIDEDRTDKRLIQILNELTINIVEQPENNIDQETKEGIIIYTDTLIGEEIENLRQAGTKEIKYENLKSNTTYIIEITGNVQLGNTQEEIPVTYNYKEFTTLKIPAKVEIRNQFVTGNLIDFDVRIYDLDNSVLNNKVRMELRNSSDDLIDLQEITTNEDYIRKTYEKLKENQTYKLSFYADQYNEGSTDSTYKVNYLIKEIEIATEPGISGSIGLTELTRKATGKNLVDVSSENKWYVYPTFNTDDYYGKEYDKETKKLTLGGHGNYRRAVYDLREYAGQEITMSFKAKVVSGSQNAYIQNSKTDTNRTKIEGLTEEWKDFQYTLTVDNTGYLGFYMAGGNGIEVQELQIELGNKKTSYEEFKYKLQSNYTMNLEDKRDEITTNDYYIKVYEDNNLIRTDRYEEIPEENVITNAIKIYEAQTGKQYKVELVIKIKDREYVLSKLEYNTQDTEEIKGIQSLEDYKMLQPYGKYYVLTDLNVNDSSLNFGGTNMRFMGELDFRGHSMNVTVNAETTLRLFYAIGNTGKIRNFVYNISLANEDLFLNQKGNLFLYNYGTIENIYINLVKGNNRPNNWTFLLGWKNEGTIDGFVVNYQDTLSISYYGGLINSSNGTIKNGYIYGKDVEINVKTPNSLNTSALIYNQDSAGVMENIYNLVSVKYLEGNTTDTVANFIIYNKGTINNIYSVNMNGQSNVKKGPNVYSNTGSLNNSYYIYDDIFNNSADIKTSKVALYDSNFQSKILNNENKFIIEKLLENDYFPQLDMPDCMPEQQYINLPVIADNDLADIISFKEIEKTNNTAIVEANVYNPAGEEIKEIKIANLNVEIIDQQYSNKYSTVTLRLSVVSQYLSSYSVMSLTVKGALSNEYKREYETNERTLNIEFFREINNIDDWKNINKFPKENYKLMNDLDFKNSGTDIAITTIFYGKLDGNDKTIKNINFNNYSYVISILYGEISNLTIDNLTIVDTTNSERYGFIKTAYSTAKVDNVHIKNANFEINSTGNTIIGSLVGYSSGTDIINSSSSNVQINSNHANGVTVGGLIGEGASCLISNCYVQDVDIKVNGANISNGIGGLVGKISVGNISSSYTFGNITTDKENVGGICGQAVNLANVVGCYSAIDIVANGKNIGGIVGYNSNSAETSITQNLYIGNLYNSLEDVSNIISGNNILGISNFGYVESNINGEKNNSTNVPLLTREELLDINTYTKLLFFGTKYDYTGLKNNMLPKLNYKDTNQVIPGQKNNILSNAIVNLENVESRKVDNTTAELRITLNNDANLQITGLTIDGMEVQISRNVNEAGKTYLDICGKAIKFYDNYRISTVKYKVADEEVEQKIYGRIDIQFFKEINSYQDWQSIDETSSENYMLMTDIDFAGKENPKYNICVNRLITNGDRYTIKNLEINSDNGLIKDAKNEIKDISFENITINSTSGLDYIGVIKSNTANLYNIEFNNIHINTKNSNYVACIPQNNANIMEDITLSNINCTGNSYVAGLGAYSVENSFKDITGNNISINALGSNVGGIFGYIPVVDIYTNSQMENITIEDSEIYGGGTYVGGIMGAGRVSENFKAIEVNVEGNNYVGGIIGQGQYGYRNRNQFVENCNVKGRENVGGIVGYINNLYDSIIINSVIEGTYAYTGGIAGRVQNNCQGNSVIGTEVRGNQYIGGIEGYLYSGSCFENYIINSNVEGEKYVGGLVGLVNQGKTYNNYVSAEIEAIQYGVGGFAGYVQNQYAAGNYSQNIYNNYIANSTLKAESQVGGIIGVVDKELSSIEKHSNNYVEADLICENKNTVSLGIGNMPNQTQYLEDTYYYKYSTINGENPNERNEIFINADKYLTGEELRQTDTYISKLKWSTETWNMDVIADNKYPILKNSKLTDQEGIDLPIDSEHIIESAENFAEMQSIETQETLEQTFEYSDKTIQTYSMYSVITSSDGTKATRNAKLYVKDNTLYAIPSVLASETSKNSEIVPIANNLILDSYNGKEYETVLGSDGKIYDLKEPIEYPENFLNSDIESIGNNLNSDEKEVEVTYKNGDKIKFNYQTGEIISSSEANSEKTGLFDYLKEKIAEIGNSNSGVAQEITNKYEASKELQTKLEETSVEEAIEKQNIANAEQGTEGVTTTENNVTNNSLTENKYISVYDEKTDDYLIYNEEELLDTTKQEVVSENEKIEANNLSEYYASEGKTKNTKMGIVWIVISIIGVGITLFVLGKKIGIRGRC